jgi:hypothetical protein
MNDSIILTKLNELPETLKKEVLDFIDFLIKKQETVSVEKHPTAGCMKGTFIMKDDFDEPLEDFQEYMK